MLNYIWGGMMIIALVFGAFNGKLEVVTSAAMQGSMDAITMLISLCGVMCLWTGLIKIASNTGIIIGFAKILCPITSFLFPNLPKNSPAMDAIVMNMVANMFGMSNAATPLGITAMKELSRLNGQRNIASNEMCMFAVINTASLQIIPSTLIALRQSTGSIAPTEIIFPSWIVSIISITVGVCAVKLFQTRRNI